MKKIMIALTILLMMLALAACHEHAWKDATCTTPKTCTECGEVEGEALGHNWKDATCEDPKTCTVCGETEGVALGHDWLDATCTKSKRCAVCGRTNGAANGHDWAEANCTTPKTCNTCGETTGTVKHNWVAATCTEPKICKDCGETEGSSKGHSWKNATCTEPKTCKDCGETEGSSKGHSWKNATCTAPKTCNACGKTEGSPASHNWKEATCTTPKTCTSCGKTEGNTASHNWQSATCKAPKTCKSCGKTEGGKGGHSYSNGTCKHCGASDPNYVPTFGAGETWTVAGRFEFTITSVTTHRMCEEGYLESSYCGGTYAVMINYTYKNLGSEKLQFTDWDFEVYDASGVEGDPLFFNNYCDHGVDSKSCITGGTCVAKLPVALVNNGNSVTIYVEKNGKTGIFTIPITEPSAEDSAAEVGYSRVKGEFTYKYNDFVGTRGDGGTKVVFIPKNTALKSQDNNRAMMLMPGVYENGIVVKECDGYGKFDTGEEAIIAGDYVVIVISKNTTRSGKATADELKSYLGSYVSDEDLETLALFMGYRKVAIDSMTLKEGYVHTISHDFGITYF